MAAPLREPFFLRGRRSALQRAVLMSLVLAGLSIISAWILAVADFLAFRILMLPGYCEVMATAWGFVLTLTIYGPLGFWNYCPRWFHLLTLVSTGAVAYLWTSTTFHVEGVSMDVIWVLVSGALLFRLSWAHAIAFVISVLAVPHAVTLAVELDDSVLPLASVPLHLRYIVATSQATQMFGLIFGATFIPWGIPFWWTPKTDQSRGDASTPGAVAAR